MHVTEKIIKPLTEAKYLNADNVDRYRSIMRIFYENYEKLKYKKFRYQMFIRLNQNYQDYINNISNMLIGTSAFR